jgi:hypothetical protein
MNNKWAPMALIKWDAGNLVVISQMRASVIATKSKANKREKK